MLVNGVSQSFELRHYYGKMFVCFKTLIKRTVVIFLFMFLLQM